MLVLFSVATILVSITAAPGGSKRDKGDGDGDCKRAAKSVGMRHPGQGGLDIQYIPDQVYSIVGREDHLPLQEGDTIKTAVNTNRKVM